MSDHDPNSELMPPGPPLPEDETPAESRFDSESPAVRPDETLLEPSTIVEMPGQQDMPNASVDEPQFDWRAPEPVQYSYEPPAEPIESIPLADILSAYGETSAESPALPVEAADADQSAALESSPPHFGELTPPEDGRVRRAAARQRELMARIRDLTTQIERYPHTPANFVVRGEVYLSCGQAEAAAVDFQRALDLAESRVDELPWGYVNAGLIDRAREGLNEAQDRLESART
ncbi:MAG: hypothetical protein ACYDBJ_15580 [Aggregatilineales bacterium]